MRLRIFLIPHLFFAWCQIVVLTEGAILPNFYPFGRREGDQVVPPNDDGSSGGGADSNSIPLLRSVPRFIVCK